METLPVKLVKRLTLVSILLIVLLAAGLFAALYYVNDLVKLGVEKGGTVALGTKTSLQSADVGLFSGKAALSNLTVANPDGFKAPEFFSLGSAAAAVSLNSLRSDVVEVPSIELSTIRVALERKDGRTNYKVILDNLAKLPTGSGKSGGSDTPGKKFIIRDLKINDAKVTVDMLDTPIPLGSLVVPIDRIHLSEIGTASKGLPLADIAGIVIRAVLGTASANGQGIIPADILGDLQSQLGALGSLDQLGVNVQAQVGAELQKAADKARTELEKGLGDAASKVQEEVKKGLDNAVKDLFGGDKKK
jgi:uncharacterized protein involved in outer membrane biogenesis